MKDFVLKNRGKLPFLEGLCWNIKDPYSLTPEEMLSVMNQIGLLYLDAVKPKDIEQ